MSFAHLRRGRALLHAQKTLESRPEVESGIVQETASKCNNRVYQHLDFRKNTALSVARFYL